MSALYAFLLSITVTIHVSKPYPTQFDPNGYGLNTCTGVFVAPDEILTAGHCVHNSRGRQWARVDGKSYAVDVIKTDYAADLALLKVQAKMDHTFAKFGKQAKIGDTVHAFGASHGYTGTYSQGVVNNLVIEDYTNTLTLLHSAGIAGGASGGGLFSDNWRLVGINVATIRGFSEAVDVTVIQKFLEK